MKRRTLSDLRAAGELEQFRPAVDRLRGLRQAREPRLRDWYRPDSAAYVGRAPARLDVMGGIADYSGALVLELPLARSTWATVQRQESPLCEIATLRDGSWHHYDAPMVSLASPDFVKRLADEHGDRWPAYVVGVVHRCAQRAELFSRSSIPGFRITIESTVPEGKGVASSAALEVSVMAAMAAACDDDMSRTELATECQWVENHLVGAPCGIMDQMTSACGLRDRLLRLRCQPGIIEGYVEVPSGYRFYGIDSGVRHAVTGDDYSSVRTAAFMGYRMIAARAGLCAEQRGTRVAVQDQRWQGYLANISSGEFSIDFESHLPEFMSGAEFLAEFDGISDDVTTVRPEKRYRVRQATAHPILEQERVSRFAHRLSDLSENPRVAGELGQLMYASHASYSACGLGSEGTDRLVEMVADLGGLQGVFGAKITGGGSGGTVAILGREDAAGAVRDIAARYESETGRRAEVFEESGPGAAQTGVLVLEPKELDGA
jgi:L-arabinokinase